MQSAPVTHVGGSRKTFWSKAICARQFSRYVARLDFIKKLWYIDLENFCGVPSYRSEWDLALQEVVPIIKVDKASDEFCKPAAQCISC